MSNAEARIITKGLYSRTEVADDFYELRLIIESVLSACERANIELHAYAGMYLED